MQQTQWRVKQLVQATEKVGGHCLNPEQIETVFSSVSTDSRQIEAPALYIALKGERFDGHQFILPAIEAGAVAVLLEAAYESQLQTLRQQHPQYDAQVAWVVVRDTRQALGAFAAWHRQQLTQTTWIGVTGSNGKTTTKTLLRTILENFAPTVATQGNLNNELGVPRTLLTVTPKDTFAVIEMGANHLGEIAYLTALTQPNIALITSLAPAHIEGFGGLENIIQAKGEIFQGLSEEGVAIFPAQSIGSEIWQQQCQSLGRAFLTFGESANADVQLLDFEQKADRICFSLQVNHPSWRGQQFHLCLPTFGRHNAMNACAAFAVCLALKLDLRLVPATLQNYEGEAGRLHAQTLPTTAEQSSPQITVIDDSYNANPSSVKAGIETLVSLGQTTQGQTLLCLGAMAELGDSSFQLHQEVGRFAKEMGVSHLWTAGESALPAALAFGEGSQGFPTAEALADALKTQLQQGQLTGVSHVLVKGSRSAQMEKVVQALQQALQASH